MTEVREGTFLGWWAEVDEVGMIHMEDVYDTGIDDLWNSLTDPRRLVRWLGRFDGDLREGGTFAAAFTSSWEGSGTVQVCEAPHRLVVEMRSSDPADTGPQQISAVLIAEGPQTRLVIEERGFATGEAPGYAAGWQVHVEDLRSHLDGREPEPWQGRWRQIRPRYDAPAD